MSTDWIMRSRMRKSRRAKKRNAKRAAMMNLINLLNIEDWNMNFMDAEFLLCE
jgi:hypothetical protein